MSDKTSFISQIKDEEARVAKMLENIELDNDARLSSASEEADVMVDQAYGDERVKAKELILKAKEDAKSTYAKLLVDSDNIRRDVVQTGRINLIKGKTHVIHTFMSMFE